MEKIVVFEDPKYEALTKEEIKQAKGAMENVLTAWNAMKLTTISSTSELYDLLNVPQQMYSEGVSSKQKKTTDTNTPAPETISPDPNAFYSAARAAKELPFTDRTYSLFIIEKGKVAINDEAAKVYYLNRTIYASNESQAQFARDVETFARVFNEINGRTGGSLLEVAAWRQAWSQLLNLPPEPYIDTLQYPAAFRTEKLRELIELM